MNVVSINEYKTRNGKIILNVNKLLLGEEVDIFSCGQDVMNNQCVDVYTIFKNSKGLHIKYSRNNSIYENGNIDVIEKISIIGTSRLDKDVYKKTALTQREISIIKEHEIEYGVIRMGQSLEGRFESGYEFSYPNIIAAIRKNIDRSASL